MNSGAKGAEGFLSIRNGQNFSTNMWQMMTFLNPLDALIPKIPFGHVVIAVRKGWALPCATAHHLHSQLCATVRYPCI